MNVKTIGIDLAKEVFMRPASRLISVSQERVQPDETESPRV